MAVERVKGYTYKRRGKTIRVSAHTRTTNRKRKSSGISATQRAVARAGGHRAGFSAIRGDFIWKPHTDVSGRELPRQRKRQARHRSLAAQGYPARNRPRTPKARRNEANMRGRQHTFFSQGNLLQGDPYEQRGRRMDKARAGKGGSRYGHTKKQQRNIRTATRGRTNAVKKAKQHFSGSALKIAQRAGAKSRSRKKKGRRR